MPVYTANDVQAAFTGNPDKCESRSLLAAKFPELRQNDRDTGERLRSLERFIKCKPARPIQRPAFHLLFNSNTSLTFPAVLGARLIINQAGGVIENAGLCIDRHTGEPYIPGSALKGIAANAARTIEAPIAERAIVFGFAPGDDFSSSELPNLRAKYPAMDKIKNMAGAVAFLPAYSTRIAELEMDILTCHHPDYYSDQGMAQALDNESPNPQVFPTVKAGTEFVFTVAQTAINRIAATIALLQLPSDFNPLAKAAEWLKAGLTDHGIGAKTAAGYGWFDAGEHIQQAFRQKIAEEQTRKQQAELAAKQRADDERQRQADAAAAQERREKEAADRERLQGMTEGQLQNHLSTPDKFLRLPDADKLKIITVLRDVLPDLWRQVKENMESKKPAERRRGNLIVAEINRLIKANKLEKMP